MEAAHFLRNANDFPSLNCCYILPFIYDICPEYVTLKIEVLHWNSDYQTPVVNKFCETDVRLEAYLYKAAENVPRNNNC